MNNDNVLGRRGFLRFGASLAGAGAAARLGVRHLVPASAIQRSGPDSFFDASAVTPVLQHFYSRPDLQPPVASVHTPPAAGIAPGLVFTDCHNGPGQQGPIIFDSNAEVVWFKPLSVKSASPKAFNFRVQSYRGAPVMCFFNGAVVAAHGQGHYELYDSSYRLVTEVHGGNGYMGDLHEFLITPRQTALFTCYGLATGDMSKLGGTSQSEYYYGVAQEVDIATGKVLFEWRSDQHIALAESYSLPAPKNPKQPWDYFHINSICVDPTDNNLIISGRNTWAFYKVNRKTGALMWRAGGKKSDFQMGANTHFAFQHHVTRYPSGIVTIFDNEAGPPKEASQSRGLVVMLDEKHKKVSFVRQYDHNKPVTSSALGSVQELPNGNCFMGWGESSYFTEYGPTGDVLLDVRLAPGNVSYRAFKQVWTGRPAEPPAIAVRKTGKTTTVYASWNGSTETAAWQVLGGPNRTGLRALTKATRTGFETAIALTGAPVYVAVEALDRSDKSLARSAALRAH